MENVFRPSCICPDGEETRPDEHQGGCPLYVPPTDEEYARKIKE